MKLNLFLKYLFSNFRAHYGQKHQFIEGGPVQEASVWMTLNFPPQESNLSILFPRMIFEQISSLSSQKKHSRLKSGKKVRFMQYSTLITSTMFLNARFFPFLAYGENLGCASQSDTKKVGKRILQLFEREKLNKVGGKIRDCSKYFMNAF